LIASRGEAYLFVAVKPYRLITFAAVLVAPLSLFAGSGWKQDRPVDGLNVEWREVQDSPFHEYRITTQSTLPLDKLCHAVWGKDAKVAGDFKKRVVIKETDHERWTYEQVGVPLVKDRDCLMHVTLVKPADTGSCEVKFETTTHPDYPPDPNFVRVPTVRGYWSLNPVREGYVSVTYVVYSEPGGAVPALFARGGQRDAAVGFMKTILARADSSEASPRKVGK
jgi:hypothetical protein